MKKAVFMILAVVVLSGCMDRKTDEGSSVLAEEEEYKGMVHISGSYALYPLMLKWADEFSARYPDLDIRVDPMDSDAGMRALQEGECDIAMISRDLTGEEKALDYWSIPVARDGVLPVMNDQNPFMGLMLKFGVDHDQLAGIFSGRGPSTWGRLFGQDGEEAIQVYMITDEKGTNEVWLEYLGLERNEIVGEAVENGPAMVDAVNNSPLSMGYARARDIYDTASLKPAGGILPVPIDCNENGRIDEKEKFYEDLCRIQRAVYLGAYPCKLCRCLSLVMKQQPEDPATKAFIRYMLTDGQPVAEKSGYSIVRHCQANEVIERFLE